MGKNGFPSAVPLLHLFLYLEAPLTIFAIHTPFSPLFHTQTCRSLYPSNTHLSFFYPYYMSTQRISVSPGVVCLTLPLHVLTFTLLFKPARQDPSGSLIISDRLNTKTQNTFCQSTCSAECQHGLS